MLVLFAGTVGWFTYKDSYQPLAFGGFGSNTGRNLTSFTVGAGLTGFAATGPTGSVSEYHTSLRNRGPFDVRLLGIEPSDVTKETVRWKVFGPGSPDFETTAGWTSRPVTLHPGQLLGLTIGIVRPPCSPGEGFTMDSAVIRWEALGTHHIYIVRFGSGETAGAGLSLCGTPG